MEERDPRRERERERIVARERERGVAEIVTPAGYFCGSESPVLPLEKIGNLDRPENHVLGRFL